MGEKANISLTSITSIYQADRAGDCTRACLFYLSLIPKYKRKHTHSHHFSHFRFRLNKETERDSERERERKARNIFFSPIPFRPRSSIFFSGIARCQPTHMKHGMRNRIVTTAQSAVLRCDAAVKRKCWKPMSWSQSHAYQ